MDHNDHCSERQRFYPLSFLFVMLTALMIGCTPHRLAFVSNSDGEDHIYDMTWFDGIGPPNPTVTSFTSDPSQKDRYPDVSPDGTRVAYASERGTNHAIVIRDLSDTTGASEDVLVDGAVRKIRPRWSPNQQRIAYVEYSGTDNQGRIMSLNSGGAVSTAITDPGPGQSDNLGHDYFDGGSKIVFTRRNAFNNSYDLLWKNADGSGQAQPLTASQSVNEILPVVSHDQSLVAYVSYIQLAAGWPEVVTVVEAGTWAPLQSFQFQPPVGGRRIGALAFSDDDQRLYIATRVPEVPASNNRDRYEIFAVKLDGSDPVRLTNNQFFDSHPSAIPPGAPTAPVASHPCLVSWWPGDGTADDAAGSNHGTLNGGMGYAPGIVGSAFSFDGNDDFVEVAPDASLNITGDLTIVLWAQRAAFGNLPASTFIMQGNTTGPLGTAGAKGAYNYHFNHYSDQISAGFFTSWGGSFGAGGPVITDTDFHHYAYVRSDGGVTVTHYLDGSFDNDVTFSAGAGDAAGLPVVIGAFRSDLASATGYAMHFEGLIDEVAVFNCALSADEIASIFEDGVGAVAGP